MYVCMNQLHFSVFTNENVPTPAAYRLYTVLPRLLKFIDNLTNWYIRFNRKRLKVCCRVCRVVY